MSALQNRILTLVGISVCTITKHQKLAVRLACGVPGIGSAVEICFSSHLEHSDFDLGFLIL